MDDKFAISNFFPPVMEVMVLLLLVFFLSELAWGLLPYNVLGPALPSLYFGVLTTPDGLLRINTYTHTKWGGGCHIKYYHSEKSTLAILILSL